MVDRGLDGYYYFKRREHSRQRQGKVGLSCPTPMVGHTDDAAPAKIASYLHGDSIFHHTAY
jgi:hypothetical protein